jgi:hypothetical protein
MAVEGVRTLKIYNGPTSNQHELRPTPPREWEDPGPRLQRPPEDNSQLSDLGKLIMYYIIQPAMDKYRSLLSGSQNGKAAA